MSPSFQDIDFFYSFEQAVHHLYPLRYFHWLPELLLRRLGCFSHWEAPLAELPRDFEARQCVFFFLILAVCLTVYFVYLYSRVLRS